MTILRITMPLWRMVFLSLFSPLLFSQQVAAETPVTTAVVTTEEASEIVVYPQVSASATVISLQQAGISAQISAQVKEVVVDAGQEVAQSDVVIKLDCSDYVLSEAIAKGQYDAAVANKVLARSQSKRSNKLFSQKLTSQQDVDATTASFDAANAEVSRSKAATQLAALNVMRCDITAPFGGLITARQVSQGEYAMSGVPLFSMINHQALEVSARISEQSLDTFTPETPFVFHSVSEYPVKLVRTVKAIDTSTRTQEARLVFTDKKPLPGTAGKVIWPSSIAHLPAEYLTTRNGSPGYFVEQQGVTHFVPLQGRFAGRSQPYHGSSDARIVTSNLNGLSDGGAVKVSAVKASSLKVSSKAAGQE